MNRQAQRLELGMLALASMLARKLQRAPEPKKLMQGPEPLLAEGLAFPSQTSAAFLHHLDDGVGCVAQELLHQSKTDVALAFTVGHLKRVGRRISFVHMCGAEKFPHPVTAFALG